MNDAKHSNNCFEPNIAKMENVVNLWFNRQLALMGKVLLVNTLMSSLFTYKMSVLS